MKLGSATFFSRNRAGGREVLSHYRLPSTHHIFNNRNTVLFEWNRADLPNPFVLVAIVTGLELLLSAFDKRYVLTKTGLARSEAPAASQRCYPALLSDSFAYLCYVEPRLRHVRIECRAATASSAIFSVETPAGRSRRIEKRPLSYLTCTIVIVYILVVVP